MIEADALRDLGKMLMIGKDAPPEVKIRSYRDSPICDVVVLEEEE